MDWTGVVSPPDGIGGATHCHQLGQPNRTLDSGRTLSLWLPDGHLLSPDRPSNLDQLAGAVRKKGTE